MNENIENQTPEFSHPIEVDKIPGKGRHVKLAPNATELSLLMQRLGLLALDNVKAKVHVVPRAGGHKMRITGQFQADITQACIVNLSPVFEKIDEEFQLDFAPQKFIEHDVELSLEDDDAYEPIEDGVLDLGEIVSQQLSLAINPYPRSKNADLNAVRDDTSTKAGPKFDAEEKPNPFAVLKKLKEKD